MSYFHTAWKLSRGRFDESVFGLTQAQLNWRLQPNSLTLGEAAIHVAGVEAWFIHQLLELPIEGEMAEVCAAATDGVVNDKPFPFTAAEITPDVVESVLNAVRKLSEPVIQNPTPEVLSRQIQSALGPIIDGQGALARLAFHPAYHQGQAHLLRTAPGFPN